jgi:hypothetical protein
MPKRRNLVCLEAKLQSGNFLIQKVNISRNKTHKRMDVLETFIGFYIVPLEWSVFQIDATSKFTLSGGLFEELFILKALPNTH